MKINKKKLGFTLVELLVVIAILAVLATVAIIGYSSFINEAHKSNDNSVVTELNHYLKAANPLDEKVPTATDAAEKLEGCGLNIAQLQPSTKDAYYGYNYETKEFVFVEGPLKVSDENIKTFLFAKKQTQVDAIYAAHYSVYLQEGYESTDFNAVYGLDVGKATVSNVTFTNVAGTEDKTDGIEVVIRTNSYNCVLTIDAESDTVTHYGKANKVDVTAVDNTNCYNEHGDIIGNINLKQGKVVVHGDCSAGAVVIDMTAAELATVTTLSADNTANKEVPIILNTSEVLWGANPNNGLINPTTNNIIYSSTGGTLPEDFNTMTNEQKEVAIATASEELVQGVAAIGNVTYASLEEAYEAAVANDTIILLKDVSYTNNEVFYLSKSITINGNNKTFTATGSSASYAIYFFNEEEGVANKAEIKNLTVNTTGYQAGILTNDDGLTNANPAKLYLNNVSIYSEGECIYANGHTQTYASNCTLNRAGNWKPKTGGDEIYYSALIIGYGAKMDFKDSVIVSEGTGVATFPSGGTINVYNTSITVSNPNNAYVHSYAIWSRIGNGSTPITEYADAGINIYSGNVIGALNTTDESTIHDSFLIITGGTFSEDPTAYVDAENYQVKGTGPYIVSVK